MMTRLVLDGAVRIHAWRIEGGGIGEPYICGLIPMVTSTADEPEESQEIYLSDEGDGRRRREGMRRR